MEPIRVILMSCGSYNPPTNMHLRMFEIARDHLHRMGTHSVVGGVISPVHDHYRKKDLVSAEHRCAMLKLALQNSEWIRVSTWETRQNNWTQTRLSLQHHQNLLNTIILDSADVKNRFDSRDLEWIPENLINDSNRTPIQIKLLCGADLLESFGTPGLWLEEDIDAIVGQHGLVVITREGSNPNKFIYDSDILSKHMHNIYIVTEWICNEVSSTKIRRALKRGESVRYLIQDPVIDYIHKHGLYNTKTSATTKFDDTAKNSNNYLHIDSKYETAFLTPSPSDITMDSPSPVEIISIDISQAVITKNNHNSPKSQSLADTFDTERMREKFLNVIADNGNKVTALTPKSTYPGQAKQIIATETGESQIFREVGLHSTGTNNEIIIANNIQQDLNTTNNSISVELSVNDEKIPINEESSLNHDDTTSSELDSERTIELIELDSKVEVSITIVEENTSKTIEKEDDKKSDVVEKQEVIPISFNGKEIYDRLVQVRKSLIDLTPKRDEIDGKYIKSVVNARKSPKRVKNLTEQVVPMMEESDNHDYPAKSREKCDSKANSHGKVYQGSLESINFIKPSKLAQKSRSYELIKSDLKLKEFKPSVVVNKSPEQSSIDTIRHQIDEPEHIYENQPLDEYCSECSFSKNQALAGRFPRKELYTVRSTNSSPLDVDSGECEICSSCHIEEIELLPEEPQCELCEICGDIAMEMDVVASSRPESDDLIEARMHSSTRPANSARRGLVAVRGRMDGKIFEITDEDADGEEDINEPIVEHAPSTSIEEYSDDDDSTLDDVEFEIENCGIDVVTDGDNQPLAAGECKEFDENNEITNCEIMDETKRMTRGSSMITRSATKVETRRRYLSVDNLPSSKQIIKTIPKDTGKFGMKQSRKVTGSVDNIRGAGMNKSTNKFRMSADDVGKQCQEVKEPDDNDDDDDDDGKVLNSRKSEADVKFIINKRSLKIISDRETAF